MSSIYQQFFFQTNIILVKRYLIRSSASLHYVMNSKVLYLVCKKIIFCDNFVKVNTSKMIA